MNPTHFPAAEELHVEAPLTERRLRQLARREELLVEPLAPQRPPWEQIGGGGVFAENCETMNEEGVPLQMTSTFIYASGLWSVQLRIDITSLIKGLGSQIF